MTRNEARAHWEASGLTYDALTHESLETLRKMVDRSLKASGLIRGTFRMRPTRNILREGGGRKVAELRCKADYFEDREAITFDPYYFIGFAGWADDTNIQPILSAFCAWVDEMAAATSGD